MTSVSESRGLMLYMRKESGLLLWHLLARCVPCRMQEEHWLEPSAFLLQLCDPDASFQHRLLGSPIPMAIAPAARRQRHEHILYPGRDLALRTHMFEEHQISLRFEH